MSLANAALLPSSRSEQIPDSTPSTARSSAAHRPFSVPGHRALSVSNGAHHQPVALMCRKWGSVSPEFTLSAACRTSAAIIQVGQPSFNLHKPTKLVLRRRWLGGANLRPTVRRDPWHALLVGVLSTLPKPVTLPAITWASPIESSFRPGRPA